MRHTTLWISSLTINDKISVLSCKSKTLGGVACIAVVRLLLLKHIWMSQCCTTSLLIISMTNNGHLRYGLLSLSAYVSTKSSNLKYNQTCIMFCCLSNYCIHFCYSRNIALLLILWNANNTFSSSF